MSTPLHQYMVSLRDSHGSIHVGLFQAPSDSMGALLSAVAERFDLKNIPADFHVEDMGKARKGVKEKAKETADYRSAPIPTPAPDDLEPIEFVDPSELLP